MSKKHNYEVKRLKRKIAVLVLLLSVLALLILLLLIMYWERSGEGMSQFSNDYDEDTPVSEIMIEPLFVGDSRTVGLARALGDSIDNHAQNGTGFDYLYSLDERIRTSGSDCIIIGFGVNDLKNLGKYIDYANALGSELEKPVYFLTVNPVDEEREKRTGYDVKNDDIDSFNEALEANAVDYRVLDTNYFLQMAGFNTLDGLHYDDETYIKIYEYIMRELDFDAKNKW